MVMHMHIKLMNSFENWLTANKQQSITSRYECMKYTYLQGTRQLGMAHMQNKTPCSQIIPHQIMTTKY